MPHARQDNPSQSIARPATRDDVMVNVANFTWVNGFDLYDIAPGVPAWTEYFAKASLGPTGQLDVPAEVDRCSVQGDKVWGASFDDGPSEFTHYVQEYFKTKSLLTTFFVVGSQVAMFPSVLKDSFDAGHAIGIHCWSHTKLTSLTDDQIIAEFVLGAKSIADTLGVYPKYFRPPYGESDQRVIRLAATVGLTSVVWSADSGDSVDEVDISETLTNEIVPANFARFVAEHRDQDISLQHDLREYEAKIASTAMDILLTGGYNILPIHKCLDDANPYGNNILKGFFESGQFDTKDAVLPPWSVNSTSPNARPSSSESWGVGTAVTGNAAITNTAAPSTRSSSASPVNHYSFLASLATLAAVALVL
ncbi:chitin deacetylase [Chytriomyces hyalinus]|nr:chitin deacetylase [Chytriomyces hyalinus]